MSGDLTSLVKSVDNQVKQRQDKKLRAVVVVLAKDRAAAEARLKALAEREKIEIPLTVALDGPSGPKAYKLNPKAEATVLVYRNKKVVANFAYPKFRKANTQEILKAADKMLQAA